MVRGCQRRVVFIKNTDSEIFSEAYFILVDGVEKKEHSDGDIIREANRIIEESIGIERPEPRLKKIGRFFLYHGVPFLSGLIFAILLALIF